MIPSGQRAYVLILPNFPADEFDRFVRSFLEDRKCEWWHWIKDVWIFFDPDARNSLWWMEELTKVLLMRTGAHFLMLELSGSWTAQLPTEAFEWLQQKFGGSVYPQLSLAPPKV